MYNLTGIFSIFRFGIVHKNALLGFGKQRDNVHSFSIKGNETELERTVKGSKLSANRRESIVNFDRASPLEYLIFMVSTSCLKLNVQELKSRTQLLVILFHFFSPRSA